MLVSRRVILTSCREGASLTLAGHLSSDGVTVKMPYEVDASLYWPFHISLPPLLFLLLDWLKLKWNFSSIYTELRRWTLVETVINVDGHPVLALLDLIWDLEVTRIDIFWLHFVVWQQGLSSFYNNFSLRGYLPLIQKD